MQAEWDAALQKIRQIKHEIGIIVPDDFVTQYSDRCSAKSRCVGHGDLMLLSNYLPVTIVSANSFEIGAILWYYCINGAKARHFRRYICKECKLFLLEQLG